MIFKKYEFTDKAAWETAKKSITTTDAEGNVLWSVDILWNQDSDKFSSEAVYPEPDDVVHTFAGDDNLWVKTYCTQYPEYCETPEEE